VDLQLPVQSVLITNKAVSLNRIHAYGKVYWIHHYVLKEKYQISRHFDEAIVVMIVW
jgi:hypothetical protein